MEMEPIIIDEVTEPCILCEVEKVTYNPYEELGICEYCYVILEISGKLKAIEDAVARATPPYVDQVIIDLREFIRKERIKDGLPVKERK